MFRKITIVFILLSVFLLQAQITHLEKRPLETEFSDQDIVLWKEFRSHIPVRIYCIRFKLESTKYQLGVGVPPKRTLSKVAETSLMNPIKISKVNDFICAVNCNAFVPLANFFGVKNRSWYEGKNVGINGWAKNRKREFSPVQKGYYSFWLDEQGKPYMGNLDTSIDDAILAVAGFGALLVDGVIKVRKNDIDRHPRTMIGIDKNKKFFYMVVVDGRQAGTSEGMSAFEQAEFMKELNCWNAINLDGGGSSVLVASEKNSTDSNIKIINMPSSNPPRPIAVMLGIKRK